jgi:hypothetical protein
MRSGSWGMGVGAGVVRLVVWDRETCSCVAAVGASVCVAEV